MKTSKRAFLLRLAITFGLLALLFSVVVDPSEVADKLRDALDRPRSLALALLLYCVLGSLIRGRRWKELVHALGHEISTVRTTQLFLVGTFFNQFLPTGIGGDVVRALALGREGLGRARAASTVILDRAIGILPLMAVGLIALPFVRDHIAPSVAATLLLLGLAGVSLLMLLFKIESWLPFVERLPLAGRVLGHSGVRRFLESFAQYDRRSFGFATALGFVFALLLVGANAALGDAIGIEGLGLFDWAIFVPLVAVSTIMPSIGGWGVREVLYTGLLSTLPDPVPGAEAAALSILFGGMNLVLATAGGILTGMGATAGLSLRGEAGGGEAEDGGAEGLS